MTPKILPDPPKSSCPPPQQMLLFTHIRLAHGFSNHKKRLQAVQARLHAISILGRKKGLIGVVLFN